LESLGLMGRLRPRHLGRAFERTCRLQQNPRALQVPRAYSENSKLAHWVSKQRKKYKLQQQGKKSQMTPARIRELESLGFQWDCSGARGFSSGATWEDRLSELVDYRKIHGNSNVF
jgi:hypothetical protein